MTQPDNNAQTRLRERAFTLGEEAHGHDDEAFRLWHKFRPLIAAKAHPQPPKAKGKSREA